MTACSEPEVGLPTPGCHAAQVPAQVTSGIALVFTPLDSPPAASLLPAVASLLPPLGVCCRHCFWVLPPLRAWRCETCLAALSACPATLQGLWLQHPHRPDLLDQPRHDCEGPVGWAAGRLESAELHLCMLAIAPCPFSAQSAHAVGPCTAQHHQARLLWALYRRCYWCRWLGP